MFRSCWRTLHTFHLVVGLSPTTSFTFFTVFAPIVAAIAALLFTFAVPHTHGSEFTAVTAVAALQRENPQLLEAALAERAWTCPAWKKGPPTANNQDDDDYDNEDGENQITKSTTTTTKE